MTELLPSGEMNLDDIHPHFPEMGRFLGQQSVQAGPGSYEQALGNDWGTEKQNYPLTQRTC